MKHKRKQERRKAANKREREREKEILQKYEAVGTDRSKDTWINRQKKESDRQTGRQTDRQAGRQASTKAHAYARTCMSVLLHGLRIGYNVFDQWDTLS
mmetsp:Transcript_39756/g.78312  ORF Transcript_39756/g.78312 Transcript_39756/m.78312 type:complete len:98 (-) Transcript_39756:567-860(-)